MTQALGYERFSIAGGDLGGALARLMAAEYPSAVHGLHLTDIGRKSAGIDVAALSKPEKRYFAAQKKEFLKDGGHVAVQTKEPHNLLALDDSPVALASWLLDRFRAWSGATDLDARFGKDELLTEVMLYWVTRSAVSSLYNYYVEAQALSQEAHVQVETPVGVALFATGGTPLPPRELAERSLNVRRWNSAQRGGHFAALLEPELYARDVSEFFASLRDAA